MLDLLFYTGLVPHLLTIILGLYNMKLIQADRDTLLKPLQMVTGIVERRHTLPILSNVLIERKDEKISFVATDLEIQITTSHRMATP